MNRYPNTLFDPIIKKRICQFCNTQKNTETTQDLKNVSTPYIRGTSENIQQGLQKYHIKVAHKTNNCSQQVFSKMKPEIELSTANLVYKIKRRDCEGTYANQTKQYLHKRCSNYLNRLQNIKADPSALAKHALGKIINLISNTLI